MRRRLEETKIRMEEAKKIMEKVKIKMEEEKRRRMEEEMRRRIEEEENRWRMELDCRECSSRMESGMRNNIDDLARRVMNGEFRNGPERKNRLGNLYASVQNRVYEMLGISKRYNKIDNSLDKNMGNSMKNNMMNNNMPIQNSNKSTNCNNNESNSFKLKESKINNIKEEDKIKKWI